MKLNEMERVALGNADAIETEPKPLNGFLETEPNLNLKGKFRTFNPGSKLRVHNKCLPIRNEREERYETNETSDPRI